MAQSSSNFKIILLAVFVVGAVVGILVFAGIIPIGSSSTTTVAGSVTVWGTLDDQVFTSFLNNFNVVNQNIRVVYVQKDPNTFAQDLIEAIAAGNVPDLVLLPNTLAWRFRNKFTHIPFTSLPEQTFQTTFISGANIFSESDGSLAIPWLADPLIMYYNQDLLAGAGIAQAPKTWPDFAATIPLLTKKQADLTITQSAAALGAYKNITYAKDILALLFLEDGNNFINYDNTGNLSVHFGVGGTNAENLLAEKALDFYVAFGNPVDPAYTWNEGLPQDRDAFVQGTLAYYFGHASDLPEIRAQNPNLNFNIGLPPQFVNAPIPITTGTIYGLAIPKGAPNQLLSYTAATLLSSMASEQSLVQKAGASLTLVPARRDVIAQKPVSDPYMTLLYNCALIMRPWLDPDPQSSSPIFQNLVGTVASGLLPTDQALLQAGGQISVLGATI